MNKRLLFIDDQLNLWEKVLQNGLGKYGYEIRGEENPSRAIEAIESFKPDIILLDILFSERNLGKPTLEMIKSHSPHLPVMMITSTMEKAEYRSEDYAAADYRYAKEALTGGDFSDLAEKLDVFIEKYREKSVPSSSTEREEDSVRKYGFLVGQTKSMKAVADMIDKVANQDITVLISGESGTGKELVARAIHGHSNRRERMFMPIVCAAMPKDLLETELFGHEKGAFTGAISQKKGKFELAEEGTIFLDEIGEMLPDTQVKLLRFLQEKTFERVGGSQVLTSKARVIAATNKDLQHLIKEGKFREDLFFRLNGVPIHLPPLRERLEDIHRFFKYFVEKGNIDTGKKILPVLREDVRSLFLSYPWPGNTREFENIIYRAVALAQENILQVANFPSLAADPQRKNGSEFRIPAIVDQIFEKKLTWKDIKDEFGARSKIRREILLSVENRWRLKYHKRPTSKDMASLLGITASNMRRILSECKLRLTKTP